MASELDELEQRIDRAWALVAFAVNRHLIEHMRRIAKELNMDFESAHIYGTLAHMNVAPLLPPGIRPSEVLEENGRGTIQGIPVRLTDLAQVTGLPRETVRRKLEALQEKGKVMRTADGLWCYDKTGVNEDTIEFTKKTIVRFLRTADEMRATLKRVDL